MIKKLLLSFILCLNLLLPAYSVEDDNIIAPVAIFVKLGMITTPKWYDAFNYKSAFVQWDAKEKNKLAVFVYLGAFSDFIAHYNEDATDKKYDYRYDSGYVRQYVLEHDIPVALYKLAGDTIYQYDNNPDLKKGFLGFLGFCEDGPGHLISTTKILDDGSLVKFDSSGNKVISFKITDPRIISLYNSNDQKIGFYRLLTREDISPEVELSESSGKISAESIVPTLLLLAQSGQLKNSDWIDKLSDVDSVYCYNNNNAKNGYFTQFGDEFYHYDKNNAKIGNFSLFGDDVYQYDAYNRKIGHFAFFGNDIYQYDAYNRKIGHFAFFGNSIYQYDKYHKKIGSFSLFGQSILQYDRYGKKIAEFSLF